MLGPSRVLESFQRPMDSGVTQALGAPLPTSFLTPLDFREAALCANGQAGKASLAITSAPGVTQTLGEKTLQRDIYSLVF